MKKFRYVLAFLILIGAFQLFNEGLHLMNLSSDLALYGGIAICGFVLVFTGTVLCKILYWRKKSEGKTDGNVVSGNGNGGLHNENRTGIRGD